MRLSEQLANRLTVREVKLREMALADKARAKKSRFKVVTPGVLEVKVQAEMMSREVRDGQEGGPGELRKVGPREASGKIFRPMDSQTAWRAIPVRGERNHFRLWVVDGNGAKAQWDVVKGWKQVLLTMAGVALSKGFSWDVEEIHSQGQWMGSSVGATGWKSCEAVQASRKGDQR